VVRRFFEQLWNDRRLDLAPELIAADCVTHQLKSGVTPSAEPRGPEAIRAHVEEWLEAFPDLRFGIEQMFTAGDRVVSQCVMEGTHRGEWHGLRPTGRRVSVRMLTIHRIADRKIAEDWVILESMGFFQQLGLVPPTAELIARS
jgi:steroid delta-isomerase-like uncharacterized protein